MVLNPDVPPPEEPPETPDQPRRSRRAIFAHWHKTESLWREVYARTISTLLAAFVAYLIALAAGQVSAAPLRVIGLATALGLMVFCIFGWFGFVIATGEDDGTLERLIVPIEGSVLLAVWVYFGTVGSLCLYRNSNMFKVFGWPWLATLVELG